jgi:hypothetical protein
MGHHICLPDYIMAAFTVAFALRRTGPSSAGVCGAGSSVHPRLVPYQVATIENGVRQGLIRHKPHAKRLRLAPLSFHTLAHKVHHISDGVCVSAVDLSFYSGTIMFSCLANTLILSGKSTGSNRSPSYWTTCIGSMETSISAPCQCCSIASMSAE